MNQANKIPQSVVSNGTVTGNGVTGQNNLLNTTNETAIFSATADVTLGNFPFNLPLNATVVGISGKLKSRIDNLSVPSGTITPYLVDGSSYHAGTPVTGLGGTLQEYSFGGGTDLWGNSWTGTSINNLKINLIGTSGVELAWVSLTVFYTVPEPIDPLTPTGGICANAESVIQAQPFELAQPWLSGQTKLVLKSFKTPTGEAISLSMLGGCGGSINLTVDPDLRKEDGGNFIENFNIDASLATITNLSNGTVEIDLGDIEQRGLSFTTPYGYNTNNRSDHSAGAVVIIANNGPYSSKIINKGQIGNLVSAPVKVSTSNPTSGDDAGGGYYVGSMWFNKTSGVLYICSDASTGSAVWEDVN